MLLLTVFTGLVGLLWRRSLFLKVMEMDVMGTGVIAFFVRVAARSRLRTPILDGNGVVLDGKEAVSRLEVTGRRDLGTGPLGFIGNVIWFLVAGLWVAIGHLSSALACFVTSIGITVVPVGAGVPAGAPTKP